MKNLFDFSPSAMALHLITHKVIKCFVKQYQTDAILDMREMYNTLYKGYPVYMCVRENGFDTIKGYSSHNIDMLKRMKERGNFEVINDEEFEALRKEVVRTRGAEAYIKVYPDDCKIDVIFAREYEEFELRNIKYELLGLEPIVNVNFVESFS